VASDACKVHPLIDEFIPSHEGKNETCFTHPEKLLGAPCFSLFYFILYYFRIPILFYICFVCINEILIYWETHVLQGTIRHV